MKQLRISENQPDHVHLTSKVDMLTKLKLSRMNLPEYFSKSTPK
jgi:hypothetical protein